jgi:hypothetical protein
MRSSPTIITNRHRIARLTAWLMLWLAGFVAAWWAALGEGAAFGRRRELDKMARTACAIVVFNACTRTRWAARRSLHRHGRLTRFHRRAMIGARLRKSARGRDYPDRIRAILTLARDLERHIAAVSRRITRGFTRLRIIDPERGDTPPLALAPRSAIARADTS